MLNAMSRPWVLLCVISSKIMINLVPDNIKKKLIGDYQRRRFVVAGSLFIALILIGGILLSSFYLALLFREKSVEKLLVASPIQSAKENFDYTQEITREINRRSRMVLKTKSLFKPSIALGEMFDLASTDVAITKFSFQLDQDDELFVSISGTATDRLALVDYLEKIKNHSAVSELNAPVSNLIQGGNNDFSLTFVFDYVQ